MATPNNPSSIRLVDTDAPRDIKIFSNVDCPHRLGLNECALGMGHDGLHTAKRLLTDTIDIEVFWADEWLPLSREAELQVGGSDAEVGLA